MDPLSHAALGRALGAALTRQAPARGTAAAAVFGALAPDLDAVAMPFGWDRYLLVHEIGTHSVAGTLACAAVVAALVRMRARDTPWRTLALFAWAGALGHVLLDLLSSARIRIFWPVIDRQVSIPLVAMADPWLAAILIAALPALWLARRRQRAVAVTVLGVAVLFLGMKAILAHRAVANYRAGAGARAAGYLVQARWASLSEWQIFDRTDSHVRGWSVSALGGAPSLLVSWPAGPPSALVERSRRLGSVQNFLGAHGLPFAAVVDGPDGTQLVLWSDIRFCWTPDGEASDLQPILALNGRRLACGLWVGGQFDAGGRPIRQVVKIFTFWQTRGPDG